MSLPAVHGQISYQIHWRWTLPTHLPWIKDFLTICSQSIRLFQHLFSIQATRLYVKPPQKQNNSDNLKFTTDTGKGSCYQVSRCTHHGWSLLDYKCGVCGAVVRMYSRDDFLMIPIVDRGWIESALTYCISAWHGQREPFRGSLTPARNHCLPLSFIQSALEVSLVSCGQR